MFDIGQGRWHRRNNVDQRIEQLIQFRQGETLVPIAIETMKQSSEIINGGWR